MLDLIKDDVIWISGSGVRLPPGMDRWTLSPRANHGSTIPAIPLARAIRYRAKPYLARCAKNRPAASINGACSLIQEGLLIRRRGEGTFVTGNEDLIQGMSLKHISLTNELLLPLMKSKTLTVAKAEIKPPPLVREKLELNSDETQVVRITRDRMVAEGFRAFTINYLPLKRSAAGSAKSG